MTQNKSYIKYLASLLMFGTNGIVASFITLGSQGIVLLRTLIGSLFLIALFVFSHKKLNIFANRKHLIDLLISGIALGASWMFLYEAYKLIGVGVASLLYYCGPVIVMALSPVLFHEKLTWPKAAGFFTVILGMCLVNPNAFGGGKSTYGLIYGLMSAILYAVMVVFNKRAKSITGLENSMLQISASFITVFCIVLFRHGLGFSLGSGSLLPTLILGIVNTGIGCYFYFSSIGRLPVQTVAVCGYLEPLSALAFSMLFLGERMTGVQVAGAVLIVGGAAFAELFRTRLKAKVSYPGSGTVMGFHK